MDGVTVHRIGGLVYWPVARCLLEYALMDIAVTGVPTSRNPSRSAVALAAGTLVGVPVFSRVGRSTAGRWWLGAPDATEEPVS
jgi:hypothetical protein